MSTTPRTTIDAMHAKVAGQTIPGLFLDLVARRPDSVMFRAMSSAPGESPATWTTHTVAQVRDLAARAIVALGYDAATVKKVIRMVDLAEYKRRQAPPGPRITPRNFGKDRRYPITSKYRPEGDLP